MTQPSATWIAFPLVNSIFSPNSLKDILMSVFLCWNTSKNYFRFFVLRDFLTIFCSSNRPCFQGFNMTAMTRTELLVFYFFPSAVKERLRGARHLLRAAYPCRKRPGAGCLGRCWSARQRLSLQPSEDDGGALYLLSATRLWQIRRR